MAAAYARARRVERVALFVAPPQRALVRRSRPAILALALLAGCGGSDRAQPSARSDADVIRAWTDAVREGDYAAANALFALPVTISNVGPKVTITKRSGVNAFNRSLPCGAVLLDTQEASGGYVRATFRLVDGADSTGCEGEADVSFRIEDAHITEWLREGTAPPPDTTET